MEPSYNGASPIKDKYSINSSATAKKYATSTLITTYSSRVHTTPPSEPGTSPSLYPNADRLTVNNFQNKRAGQRYPCGVEQIDIRNSSPKHFLPNRYDNKTNNKINKIQKTFHNFLLLPLKSTSLRQHIK